MSIKNNFKHTLTASCIGYVVQAIVINFAPLLFVTFNTSYGIPLGKISLLITLTFVIQLLVDLIAPLFIDKIGYRISAFGAHIFAFSGLMMLSFLPRVLPDPYTGVLISLVFSSIGGGLIEVVVSPIVEACPHDNKNGHMSLLHSFYCWGHVIVVLASVAYFAAFGIENWTYLSALLSLIPLFNAFYYLKVPIISLDEAAKEASEQNLTISELLRNRLFWLMMLLMVCAGACELSVAQWASALAEKGLNVSKTVGDLTGPLTFAVLMGSSRIIYYRFSAKLSPEKYMLACCLLCLSSYLLISLSPFPWLSLLGCALCGWSVGVMWPGTYSIAAKKLHGGTAMFAFLALAGDLGCSVGPAIVGHVSEAYGDDLKKGILAAIVFSVIMIFGMIFCNKKSS
ncbi:MAG: MFS transporter [Ruminococcaceae bacterium]|nr:MFS transporter [Oscillospiraceae bacterium]